MQAFTWWKLCHWDRCKLDNVFLRESVSDQWVAIIDAFNCVGGEGLPFHAPSSYLLQSVAKDILQVRMSFITHNVSFVDIKAFSYNKYNKGEIHGNPFTKSILGLAPSSN